MRNIWFVFSVALVAVVGALFWLQHRDVKGRAGALDGQDIVELKAEFAALQQRMAAAESSAASLDRALKFQAPSEPGGSAKPSAAAPPDSPRPEHHVTREQRDTEFEQYFWKLDEMRGAKDDPALTSTYSDALTKVNPAFESLSRGKVDLLRCANGLCRIELTFSQPEDMMMGRSELLAQLGPLNGAASMHVDPEHGHLVAYIAEAGRSLPPFPDSND